jgi:hypothetical protein
MDVDTHVSTSSPAFVILHRFERDYADTDYEKRV